MTKPRWQIREGSGAPLGEFTHNEIRDAVDKGHLRRRIEVRKAKTDDPWQRIKDVPALATAVRDQDRWWRILVENLLAVVVAPGLLVAWVAVSTWGESLDTEAVHTRAKVVDLVETMFHGGRGPGSGGSRLLYAPVFEFTAKDGTVVRKTSRTYGPKDRHPIGEMVNIGYAGDDPNDAWILGSSGCDSASNSLLVLAVVAAGLHVKFLVNRETRRRQWREERRAAKRST